MVVLSNFSDLINNTKVVFDKYQVPRLAQSLGAKYQKLTEFDATKVKRFNKDELVKISRSIYWALAGMQIEIAYLLILKEEFDIEKLSSDEKTLRMLYLVHHYFMAIEACYRVFERYTCFLNALISEEYKKDLYYPALLKKIKNCNGYNSLKKHERQWLEITTLRNNISHQESSLFNFYDVDINIVTISSPFTIQIIEKLKNPSKYIEEIIANFKYFHELDADVIKFIRENDFL